MVWEDDPIRLAEMEKEEKDAKVFGITISQLRQQRKELGQLLTGPYAGCSPSFAHWMETCKWVGKLFKDIELQKLTLSVEGEW